MDSNARSRVSSCLSTRSPFRSPAVGFAKPNLSFANNINGFPSNAFVGIRQTRVRLGGWDAFILRPNLEPGKVRL